MKSSCTRTLCTGSGISTRSASCKKYSRRTWNDARGGLPLGILFWRDAKYRKTGCCPPYGGENWIQRRGNPGKRTQFLCRQLATLRTTSILSPNGRKNRTKTTTKYSSLNQSCPKAWAAGNPFTCEWYRLSLSSPKSRLKVTKHQTFRNVPFVCLISWKSRGRKRSPTFRTTLSQKGKNALLLNSVAFISYKHLSCSISYKSTRAQRYSLPPAHVQGCELQHIFNTKPRWKIPKKKKNPLHLPGFFLVILIKIVLCHLHI